jgi:hypothetical protein
MADYSDRIKPTDYSISTFLETLQNKNYQIPTFQREVVWERDSVKKLWDSIYRFYPIGSILIWKTDLKLQNHRSIGGHIITDIGEQSEFQYILDGQQRTTSLLTSLYGGTIEGKEGFNPTLYIDLNIADQEEIDDQSYKRRFLFWDEIDDRDGKFAPNSQKMERFRQGEIVSLLKIKRNFGGVEERVQERYPAYKDPIRNRLRIIHNVLGNYRLSFIELKGIEVSEVCQIFERINQAGKPLDIFDIVVAKTFRLEKPEIKQSGFYLRELIDNFRSDTPGNFSGLDDLTYLQVLAMVINANIPDNDILNITPVYLNRLRTEQIETVWDKSAIALRKLFDFFDNHLHLKGPRLIPYRYFYITLATYFYDNPKPDYDALKKYFWYYSFHTEDLLTNTTHLRRHIELLAKLRQGESIQLERFLINRNRMRTVYYSAAGRYATAILALLASHEPRDWEQLDRHVLNDVYYALVDRPNLHHTFPVNYVREHPGKNQLHVDCMANIVYLTQLTNIRISDDNPMLYLQDLDKPGFENVLEGHLVPLDVLEWARAEKMPENALDTFLEKRIDLILDALREKMDGIQFDVVDTREAELT